MFFHFLPPPFSFVKLLVSTASPSV